MRNSDNGLALKLNHFKISQKWYYKLNIYLEKFLLDLRESEEK